ncbi:23S rRNA m(5)U1939 methyltransferase [Moraxella macacae 0408225]|uniref:23S rRNA (uracil(1939)-C(5))-methyltransferase RlmD n=1 Tax=Moraxella macacae 0408225 TaxID=1230338 RepID=L2FA96_9GAMM|nr:23S rRNA (uracil(1939)-C(5))-methyltransferase RlmD [Moraxella macacae]ELA09393.1 23S rRNA m(5)U1939 methyltransferase [Moraxella macacae 0408225]
MTASPPPALTATPSKKGKPTARMRKRLADAPPLPFDIKNLAHDGRGVAVYGTDESHPLDKQGKKAFINFALPGETVAVKINNSKKGFEEGDAIEVLKNPHSERQTPPCVHFGICGGCSLQHWQADGQIAFKQSILAELLQHHAGVQPEIWLKPLVGDRLGYRTKARMGVRFVEKKATALVGFRERGSNFLADLNECKILDPKIGTKIHALKQLISTLDAKNDIPQLEVAMGETLPNVHASAKSVAVIVRHMSDLSSNDVTKLQNFFQQQNWQLYLQPKGNDSVHRIDDNHACATSLTIPPTGGLFYHLPKFDITFEFSPLDFTQVNLSINRQMTTLACDLLDLQQGERVLDLFCGLGNFSLPLAKQVGETGFVIGVEGSLEMTERAKMNAKANKLYHTDFFAQDLTQDFSDKPWVGQVDALLIDPPRSGAWEVMAYLPKFNAKRIVYVSCNPITLARDTKALIDNGYKLTHAGVMDMFCHTGHVESIARFEKI